MGQVKIAVKTDCCFAKFTVKFEQTVALQTSYDDDDDDDNNSNTNINNNSS